MSESIFRLRHLRGAYLKRVKKGDNFYFTNFILNRFNVNRFYKTFLRRRKYRRNKYVYRYLKLWGSGTLGVKIQSQVRMLTRVTKRKVLVKSPHPLKVVCVPP